MVIIQEQLGIIMLGNIIKKRLWVLVGNIARQWLSYLCNQIFEQLSYHLSECKLGSNSVIMRHECILSNTGT